MSEPFIGDNTKSYVCTASKKPSSTVLYFDFSDNSFKVTPTTQFLELSVYDTEPYYNNVFNIPTSNIISGAGNGEFYVFVHEISDANLFHQSPSGANGVSTPILLIEYNDLTLRIGANPFDYTNREANVNSGGASQRGTYLLGGRSVRHTI